MMLLQQLKRLYQVWIKSDFSFENVNTSKFLPADIIKRIIGELNIQNGLQTLLKHFQDPLLNKQVSRFLFLEYSIYMVYLLVILYDSR
jgi:hypothetical protein